MTNFVLTNALLILAVVLVICGSLWMIWDLARKPKEEQIDQLREWLLWAVTLAERELGCGTGVLKLRYVYDMFVERFPTLSGMISFDWFSELVDDALEQMRGMLATNQAVKAIVEGDAD